MITLDIPNQMKTMTKYLTGAIMLGFAQFALAVCPADCQKECCTKDKAACAAACKKASCADKKATVGVKRAHYMVSGMTCEGCSKKITTALNKMDGVKVASVDHKTGIAAVNIVETSKNDYNTVMLAITATGFKAAAYKKECCTKNKCADKKQCAAGCTKPCCATKPAKKACAADCKKECCAPKAQ